MAELTALEFPLLQFVKVFQLPQTVEVIEGNYDVEHPDADFGSGQVLHLMERICPQVNVRYKTLPESEEFDINVSISEPSLFNICPYDQRKPTHKGRPVYPLVKDLMEVLPPLVRTGVAWLPNNLSPGFIFVLNQIVKHRDSRTQEGEELTIIRIVFRNDALHVQCHSKRHSHNLYLPTSCRGMFEFIQSPMQYTLKEVVAHFPVARRLRMVHGGNKLFTRMSMPEIYDDIIMTTPAVYVLTTTAESPEVRVMVPASKKIIVSQRDSTFEPPAINYTCLRDFIEKQILSLPAVVDARPTYAMNISLNQNASQAIGGVVRLLGKGCRITLLKRQEAHKVLIKAGSIHLVVPCAYKGTFRRHARTFTCASELKAAAPLLVRVLEVKSFSNSLLDHLHVGEAVRIQEGDDTFVQKDSCGKAIDAIEFVMATRQKYDSGLWTDTEGSIQVPLYMEGKFEELLTPSQRKPFSMNSLDTDNLPIQCVLKNRDPAIPSKMDVIPLKQVISIQGRFEEDCVVALCEQSQHAYKIPLRAEAEVHFVMGTKAPDRKPKKFHVRDKSPEEVTEREFNLIKYSMSDYESLPAMLPPPIPVRNSFNADHEYGNSPSPSSRNSWPSLERRKPIPTPRSGLTNYTPDSSSSSASQSICRTSHDPGTIRLNQQLTEPDKPIPVPRPRFPSHEFSVTPPEPVNALKLSSTVNQPAMDWSDTGRKTSPVDAMLQPGSHGDTMSQAGSQGDAILQQGSSVNIMLQPGSPAGDALLQPGDPGDVMLQPGSHGDAMLQPGSPSDSMLQPDDSILQPDNHSYAMLQAGSLGNSMLQLGDAILQPDNHSYAMLQQSSGGDSMLLPRRRIARHSSRELPPVPPDQFTQTMTPCLKITEVDAAPRVQRESGSKKELHYTEVVETEMVPQRSPPCTLREKHKQHPAGRVKQQSDWDRNQYYEEVVQRTSTPDEKNKQNNKGAVAVARVEPTRQGEVHVKSKLDGEVDLMFFDNQTTPDDQHSISGAESSSTNVDATSSCSLASRPSTPDSCSDTFVVSEDCVGISENSFFTSNMTAETESSLVNTEDKGHTERMVPQSDESLCASHMSDSTLHHVSQAPTSAINQLLSCQPSPVPRQLAPHDGTRTSSPSSLGPMERSTAAPSDHLRHSVADAQLAAFRPPQEIGSRFFGGSSFRHYPDLNVKSRASSQQKKKLSPSEMVTIEQLIAGYRESAAFLYRSADELEQLLPSPQTSYC